MQPLREVFDIFDLPDERPLPLALQRTKNKQKLQRGREGFQSA